MWLLYKYCLKNSRFFLWTMNAPSSWCCSLFSPLLLVRNKVADSLRYLTGNFNPESQGSPNRPASRVQVEVEGGISSTGRTYWFTTIPWSRGEFHCDTSCSLIFSIVPCSNKKLAVLSAMLKFSHSLPLLEFNRHVCARVRRNAFDPIM